MVSIIFPLTLVSHGYAIIVDRSISADELLANKETIDSYRSRMEDIFRNESFKISFDKEKDLFVLDSPSMSIPLDEKTEFLVNFKQIGECASGRKGNPARLLYVRGERNKWVCNFSLVRAA